MNRQYSVVFLKKTFVAQFFLVVEAKRQDSEKILYSSFALLNKKGSINFLCSFVEQAYQEHVQSKYALC
jgi:hypothetical protein